MAHSGFHHILPEWRATLRGPLHLIHHGAVPFFQALSLPSIAAQPFFKDLTAIPCRFSLGIALSSHNPSVCSSPCSACYTAAVWAH